MTATKRRRKRSKPRQAELVFARTWGGRRAHAGRPKLARRKGVPRRTRPDLHAKHPVHVTLRLLGSAAGLRKTHLYREIRAVMRHLGTREDFRICHYSIQGNHVHLVCEADDRRALSRGVQVFCSMVARRINRARGCSGQVFADRYHARALATPTEVRHALCYVLNNWRHHRYDQKRWHFDPFSSGGLFDGWSNATAEAQPPWLDPDEPIPIARPRWWLLREGWRRGGGAISTREVPGQAGRPPSRSS